MDEVSFLNAAQPAVENQAVNGCLWNKYIWAGSPQFFCEPCGVSCMRDVAGGEISIASFIPTYCKNHPSKQQR